MNIKKNPNNVCKTTRKERRKKLDKFQDTAHKCFGEPFTTVGICLKNCLNKGVNCEECFKFSKYKKA